MKIDTMNTYSNFSREDFKAMNTYDYKRLEVYYHIKGIPVKYLTHEYLSRFEILEDYSSVHTYEPNHWITLAQEYEFDIEIDVVIVTPFKTGVNIKHY